MKTKIIIISFLAVFILLMMPAVPAVEFNTVMETNKQQFTKDEIRQGIAELKQQLTDRYIDIELLLIIIFSILIMVLSGETNIFMLTGTILLILGFIYEFITGDVIIKCSKMHGVFVMSLTVLIVVVEKLVISNKLLAAVVCWTTFAIGYMIGLILMFGMSSI